jgi:hypothetical protein
MGNLLAINVHAANKYDGKGGTFVFEKALFRYPSIQAGCGDSAYGGSFKCKFEIFHNRRIDISPKIKPGEGVSPMRWIVERTIGWMNHSRRLSKDYEIRTDTEENMCTISHLHTLLKRF